MEFLLLQNDLSIGSLPSSAQNSAVKRSPTEKIGHYRENKSDTKASNFRHEFFSANNFSFIFWQLVR